MSPRHKNPTVRLQRRESSIAKPENPPPPLPPLFDREGHSCASGSHCRRKEANHNIIDAAALTGAPQREPLSREEEELISSSLSSPFWGQKQLRLQKPGMNPLARLRCGGGLFSAFGIQRWFLRALGAAVWALGQWEPLELQQSVS